MEKYCNKIADVLCDPDHSHDLIVRASEIITEVTGGNMHRDNIRTVTVTEAIKNYPVPAEVTGL